ncbi:hypothetical protein O0L34_g15388 [Tuta absoluta]|nr:hypothetical protein O0L34_g15388 [Tuta absoluta]
MKVILAVLFLAVAAHAEPRCPAEQAVDWSIEKLLRHPDCNKFYKCTYGVPVEQDCVAGLHFNLATWECDWPENVDCQDRHIPGQPRPEPEPKPEPESWPEPEVKPEPESWPEPEVKPEPESWPELEAQPEPESWPEPEVKPEPESWPELEAQPEPESWPEPEVKPEPESWPEPEAQPEPEPEPEVIVVPIPEGGNNRPGPEGEVDFITPGPAPEAQPEPEPEVEAEPEPEIDGEDEEDCEDCEEDGEKEIEFLRNGCPVDPHVHWLLPHKWKCSLFYYCVNGRKELRKCPASLHFNRVLQVCDWPSDAGCRRWSWFPNKQDEGRVAYKATYA